MTPSPKRSRSTTVRTAAAIVGASLLLAGLSACGSDSSSDSADSAPPTVTRQAGELESPATTAPAGWDLTWSDEFNGPAGQKADPAKWEYKTGAGNQENKELQYYTDSARNASTDGEGRMAITALKESYGGMQYTSARLRTGYRFKQQYGRFEARMKLPPGKGLWPAFWMLGDDPGDVLGWPRRGEIDVMEARGSDTRTVHGTLHGPGYSGGMGPTKSYTLPEGVPSFSDEFHTFAVEWEPDVIRFYVDDTLFSTRTPADLPSGAKWVFNERPFTLIVNLAVGGLFPGSPDSSTGFPAKLLIDHVRVYKRAG